MSNDNNAVSMTLVYGTLYKIIKQKISLGPLSRLRPRVIVAAENAAAEALISNKTKGGAEETKDYHVASLDQEDVPMMNVTAQNLRLLPSDASLDNIESRMTSVSLGKKSKRDLATPGASLTNVLRQALQSDDTDQLDWVIT